MKWVSVHSRLPAHSGNVMLRFADGSYGFIAYYDGNGGFCYDKGHSRLYEYPAYWLEAADKNPMIIQQEDKPTARQIAENIVWGSTGNQEMIDKIEKTLKEFKP